MRLIRDFLRRRDGSSAMEFALLAPVLLALLAGGYDAFMLISRKQDMHAAVAAGAHYYMGGGGDDATARQISLDGWPNRPGDGAVTISRACTCGGAAGSCTTVCALTQQAPEIRVTLAAQSQWTGLRPAALQETETVRVR